MARNSNRVLEMFPITTSRLNTDFADIAADNTNSISTGDPVMVRVAER
jgi:hypothetical protein